MDHSSFRSIHGRFVSCCIKFVSIAVKFVWVSFAFLRFGLIRLGRFSVLSIFLAKWTKIHLLYIWPTYSITLFPCLNCSAILNSRFLLICLTLFTFSSFFFATNHSYFWSNLFPISYYLNMIWAIRILFPHRFYE